MLYKLGQQNLVEIARLYNKEAWPRDLLPKAILPARIMIQRVRMQTGHLPKGGRHQSIQLVRKMEWDQVDQNRRPKLEASRPNRKREELMEQHKVAASAHGREELIVNPMRASSIRVS